MWLEGGKVGQVRRYPWHRLPPISTWSALPGLWLLPVLPPRVLTLGVVLVSLAKDRAPNDNLLDVFTDQQQHSWGWWSGAQ